MAYTRVQLLDIIENQIERRLDKQKIIKEALFLKYIKLYAELSGYLPAKPIVEEEQYGPPMFVND